MLFQNCRLTFFNWTNLFWRTQFYWKTPVLSEGQKSSLIDNELLHFAHFPHQCFTSLVSIQVKKMKYE